MVNSGTHTGTNTGVCAYVHISLSFIVNMYIYIYTYIYLNVIRVNIYIYTNTCIRPLPVNARNASIQASIEERPISAESLVKSHRQRDSFLDLPM